MTLNVKRTRRDKKSRTFLWFYNGREEQRYGGGSFRENPSKNGAKRFFEDHEDAAIRKFSLLAASTTRCKRIKSREETVGQERRSFQKFLVGHDSFRRNVGYTGGREPEKGART